MRIISLTAVILFTTIWSLPANAASFDCSKATTETEIAICNDPELTALDELLSASLSQLLDRYSSKKELIIKEQREWIKSQSNCSGNLRCLKWHYSSWLKDYTRNMSMDYLGITNPTSSESGESVTFDRRTCEFLGQKTKEDYVCSSSLITWDQKYRSCAVSGYVMKLRKIEDKISLLLWDNEYGYFANDNPTEIIDLAYSSGGNPFRFWIEGSIENTGLNKFGNNIYIAEPNNVSGSAPLYKLGDGSSNWRNYDQHFKKLIPNTTMLLVMIDQNIPLNCLALSAIEESNS